MVSPIQGSIQKRKLDLDLNKLYSTNITHDADIYSGEALLIRNGDRKVCVIEPFKPHTYGGMRFVSVLVTKLDPFAKVYVREAIIQASGDDRSIHRKFKEVELKHFEKKRFLIDHGKPFLTAEFGVDKIDIANCNYTTREHTILKWSALIGGNDDNVEIVPIDIKT